jgi:hypothetical protein
MRATRAYRQSVAGVGTGARCMWHRNAQRSRTHTTTAAGKECITTLQAVQCAWRRGMQAQDEGKAWHEVQHYRAEHGQYSVRLRCGHAMNTKNEWERQKLRHGCSTQNDM